MAKSKPTLDKLEGEIDAILAKRKQCWFDQQPAETQAALLAMRAKYHDGGYGNAGRRTLLEAATKVYGLKVSETQFSAWIRSQ